MRRLAAIVFAGLLLCGSGAAWYALQTGPAIDLVSVMQNTGAALLEVTVDTWCPVSTNIKSDADAGKVLQQALGAMGYANAGPIQLQTLQSDASAEPLITREAKVEIAEAGGRMLMATVQSSESGGEQSAYLFMSLTDRSTAPDLAAMHTLLTKGAGALGVASQKATQLIGTIAGRLTAEQVATIVSQVMSGTAAEMKSIYNDGPLVSVSGYSARLEESTNILEGQVNVNLAMRYNEEDQCTWIFLGCPSIWESI